jgi:hypothetical protein
MWRGPLRHVNLSAITGIHTAFTMRKATIIPISFFAVPHVYHGRNSGKTTNRSAEIVVGVRSNELWIESTEPSPDFVRARLALPAKRTGALIRLRCFQDMVIALNQDLRV